MIPKGEAKGRDGRMWLNSDPDGVVSAFDTKLPFDLEHATEIKAPEGEQAEAYGWILALENRDGEIWAEVDWNYQGRWLIEDKRYLYYSPAFHYDSDGVITAMSSAGLTNKPNFYVPALNRQEETDMKLPQLIAAALGLAEDATEEQGVVAINSLKSEKDIALNRATTPDLTKFIPIETHTVALNRATTAEAKLKEIDDQKVDGLVQAAIDEGKIAPANKDMFVGMCRAEGGVEQFEAFVKTSTSIATNAQVAKPKVEGGSQLDKDELAMCRKMNLTEKEFLASKHSIASNQELNKDA